jgi:hypothetical protein
MIEKEVEKLLRGGIHTASIRVKAEVCLRCGERLYPLETVKRFEQIRIKLERQCQMPPACLPRVVGRCLPLEVGQCLPPLIGRRLPVNIDRAWPTTMTRGG